MGYQGGQSEEAQLYWHDEHQVWGCIDELSNPPPDRFWNAFGSRDPRLVGGLSISCEVNPAREGINARTAGVFAIDPALGHRLLLHRGRIGGGRAGVGAEAFWSNTKLPAVTAEGDPDRRFVLVADLDGPDVPGQIARFVKEVERIKAIATQAPGGKYPVFWRGRAASDPTHTQKRAWESARFTVQACDIPAESVTFARLAATEGDGRSAHAPRYWWVNQGITYDRELAGGYVWAPVRSRNGTERGHHRAVSEFEVGDHILHYQRGIRAVSSVLAPPAFAPKPEELTGRVHLVTLGATLLPVSVQKAGPASVGDP